MIFVRLNRLSVVTVTGIDAAKIANNLCTANVINLEAGEGREAFVTDARGKMLGHVCIYRTESGLQLIGASGNHPQSDSDTLAAESAKSQAESIVAHFDRYTLREKSIPEDRSADFVGIVVDQKLATELNPEFPLHLKSLIEGVLASTEISIQNDAPERVCAEMYTVPWWNEGAGLLLVKQEDVSKWIEKITRLGGEEADSDEFHRRRIQAAFPWYGIDLDATHLPQEADRDRFAISFTKGCYLGQETVARLDALGQVQKKLVRWQLTGSVMPPPGTELQGADRVVGRLTSVCPGEAPEHYQAIGFARRSHFEAGSQASGKMADGSLIEAMVI